MRYRTIVADPPWHQPSGGPYRGGARWANDTKRPSHLPYDSLSVEQLRDLPVRSLAEQSAHLYLWTTNAHIEDAYVLARHWGFTPSTLLTWAKAPRGIGLGGAFTVTTEFVLFARRGVLPALRRIDSSWFGWKRPHNRHSAKPEGFLDLVESVSPGPYLELFSRRARLGWDVWGDESLGHIDFATRAAV